MGPQQVGRGARLGLRDLPAPDAAGWTGVMYGTSTGPRQTRQAPPRRASRANIPNPSGLHPRAPGGRLARMPALVADDMIGILLDLVCGARYTHVVRRGHEPRKWGSLMVPPECRPPCGGRTPGGDPLRHVVVAAGGPGEQ